MAQFGTLERGETTVPRGNPKSGPSGRRGTGPRPAKAKPSDGHASGSAGRRVWKLLNDQEVTGRIVRLVYDTYGLDGLSEAWDEYRCLDSENDRVAPLEFTAESPFFEHFTSWLAHSWKPGMLSEKLKGCASPDEVPTKTFLAQHPDLDPLLAEYLHACIETPFRFYEVLRRDVGRRLTCRDLISGKRHAVFDSAGSKLLRPHHILYARMVEVAGALLIDAIAPWPLPRVLHPAILALGELIMDHPPGGAEPAYARLCLLSHELDLRSFYWGSIEELLKKHSVPPQLRYTSELHKAAERFLRTVALRKNGRREETCK